MRERAIFMQPPILCENNGIEDEMTGKMSHFSRLVLEAFKSDEDLLNQLQNNDSFTSQSSMKLWNPAARPRAGRLPAGSRAPCGVLVELLVGAFS